MADVEPYEICGILFLAEPEREAQRKRFYNPHVNIERMHRQKKFTGGHQTLRKLHIHTAYLTWQLRFTVGR